MPIFEVVKREDVSAPATIKDVSEMILFLKNNLGTIGYIDLEKGDTVPQAESLIREASKSIGIPVDLIWDDRRVYVNVIHFL